MNYSETLDFLYTQLPMYHRIGAAAYKTDLDNTVKICALIGNPQHKFKSVHIAGTNGKGSVSHFLASIFQEAGYKTGLYTSPHLKDFRERIRINGKMIAKKSVIAFVKQHQKEFIEIKPSFFEWTVGLAFDYFANEKVDIAIIETGLGGRLDSTNIINPELSVITNISMDHANLLGDTIEKIAYEKAGIIKKNTPVVIGRRQKETESVFLEIAKQKNAQINFAQDYFYADEDVACKNNILNITMHSTKENTRAKNKKFKILSGLPGVYQIENIITCYSACNNLQNKFRKLNQVNIANGFRNVVRNTNIMGRWQKIADNPLTYCDTGHNEDGIKQILKQLDSMNFNTLRIVYGTVNDKEIDKIITLLPKNAVYYFCRASIPRAFDENILLEKASKKGLRGTAFSTVSSALNSAKLDALSQDLILVCGSNFVVAEVV